MVTMQPPPAYSGDQAPPPPAYSGPVQQKNQKVYWGYWGVLFGTLLTWILAVAAAADDAWATVEGISADFGLGNSCADLDFCAMYHTATAFQYLATVIISVALVVIGVAAFMPAPTTGKLGLAVGIMLVLFSLFELIAFACMVAYIEKLEDAYNDLLSSYYSSYYEIDYAAGPTLGVAVVAWIFGVVGAVVTLVLLRKATTEQDGPFRACMTNRGGAPQAGVATAVPHGVGGTTGSKTSQYPTVGTV